MKQPSTDWKEKLDADEASRFERQSVLVREVHATKNLKWGKGRFLHRKTLAAVKATLEVLPNLPAPAQQGLFTQPKTYEAVVRLSHGSFDMKANTKPDIRGFAIKVFGIAGPSSLGGTTDHQDFLLINHLAFASRNSDEFLEITLTAAKKGELGLLFALIGKYGLSAGLKRIKALVSTLAKPFPGYNAESFSTAVPVAMGAYAGKIHLRPLAPLSKTSEDPARDVLAQLEKGPLAYEMSVQFFTDEDTTPIENPPAVWSQTESALVPIARLTLMSESVDSEQLKFDPWGGLEAHRPLGEIMRARKGAYYTSQKARVAG